MEAVRVRKPKLKTDEIISRLESVIVPDDPLPVEDEVFTSSQPSVSEPNILSRNEDNAVQSIFSSGEFLAPKGSNCLYPSLDEHFATDVKENQSADHEAESFVEDTQQNKVEASAPDLPMSSSVEGGLVFDSFPPPLSSEHLRNLYINRSLDLLNETENNFLKDSDFELLTAPDSSGFNIPDDPFYLLLCKYADNWGKWLQALKRLSKVLKESSEMEVSAWKVTDHTHSVDSKCQDKRTVCLKYEYEKATLIQSVLSELKETSEVSHWIIFEEIPLVAYKLVQCRNRIEEYLANILTQCSIYENLTSSQPGILIGSKVDSAHLVQLNEMRSTCSILFACLRHFWSNQYAGRTHDPTFLKHLSNWLILTAGVTVRACRSEDHIFILMQLLRLPSQLIKLFACLLQPPDPIIAWERTKNLVEFLNQPEVELILTLFAICLRPVRERARFVTPVNIGSCKQQTDSSISQNDTIWTTVDSAGESDIEEEPKGIEVNKKNKSPISTQYDICILLSDYNPNLESCTYLNPKDLNCLLGQLRIERVLQLLAYDYIPKCENIQHFSVNESGFMTSIAFADRVLSLVEACEKIYSDYVLPPGPQTHLGSWRSLAKRLARLIRLLLISIGFRIQTIVYQQQYHHVQNSQQFALILSQYDSLCIRAVNCLLLSGSGLPDAYQKAGQLTCWRNLACTLPLGLTMVKTKKELFYILLKSILQNNDKSNTHNKINEDSVYTLMKEYIMDNTDDLENVLPNLILNKLHRVLLLMGFNELGLSVVINVLGKLASLECRPRMIYNNNMPTTEPVNTSYRYELPEDEVSLIKCIMRIIFGLSVYHRPNDLINRKDNKINIKHSASSSDTSDSSITVLSLLPISPKYGCKQLIEMSNKHPQICLHLLYDLIIESALDLTTNPLLTLKLHDRISQLNLCFSDQYVRVEDILLQLVIEAPFHIMQPNNKEVEFLINSLSHYEANCFLHKLCRLFLSRFSWDAFKDLVSNVYKSAKSSVNVLTATLTDQFLSSLHISQQRLRIKSSGLNRLTHVASDLTRRTHSVENIPVSSSFLSNPDQSLSTIKDIIDWAAELLLRLIIPGSKYDQNYLIGTDSSKLKEYIDQIWFKLDALIQKNKYDQKRSSTTSLLNPIISFVMLSLQTIYSTINKDDNCVMLTSSTTKDCNFWQPQSPMLNKLLRSIFSYKHFKLTLRTFFIICKCIPSLYSNENNQPIFTNLSWPELKELFHDLFDCLSATASLLLSSESDEQRRQQQLQQFLNRLYQFPQNSISSFSLTSSSSKTMAIDLTLFFPYLLIGMFIELTNSIPYSYSLNNIIIIIINMLLDSIDCFNQLSVILLLDLLIQLEYWDRLKCFLPNEQLNPSGVDNYKLKSRMINTSVYENFQFKFKEIQELHTQNKSTESLHNIVATSLETACSWAWSRTSFIITSVKSNLVSSSSSSSYRKDNTVNVNCYSEQNKFKNILQYECIFNKINFQIIQTYLKHSTNNCQLTPPYWLLAWLQSIVHNDETMKSDTIENEANYQYLNYWKYITPFISLYQDELISAGNQLLTNNFQSSRKEITTSCLSTPVKQILQKILFESGLVQLISSNLEFHKNNNDNNPHKDELFSNQISALTDTTIAWIFSQFSLIQGVYLIHLCPVNHPICPLLIHNILCQLFNLISPSSVVDADQHLTTRHDQTNSIGYNLGSIKSRCSNNSFTPGFLLLRCLPASLFIHTGHSSYLPLSSSSPSSLSSSPSSSLNKQDYQQSLFQLIIQKIRLISSVNSHCHSNKPSFTHDFNCLIDFLCQSDVLLSRSPFLNVNDIKSNSKLSHLLDPGYQRSVIDILLCYFDWTSLTSFMQTSQSLWNTYQYMHEWNMKVSSENDNVNVLSTVSPESSVLRLQNSESHERRIELSCSSSFEVLFSSSSLMTLPSSIDQFPKYMKDTVDSLRQHAKQMCNRIECIEKLQNEFCTNILPKLYIPVRVNLLQYVECQSILPSWMPGHQSCSGGTNISCEYQTDERNKEIDELYQMNRSDIDRLINLALDVSRTAACDVLNYNDSSSLSTSISPEGGKHSNLGVNWARTVLQLENAVSYLVHKSRLITSESKNLNTNATRVSSESSSSSSLYPSCGPTTTTATSINDQLNVVQNIGLQCFQQLCQNLSGPLLQCPLTKQVLSKCVGELASEFLTNLSTQHQLLLDMLVALPHLSNLLSSTFIPPNPSSLSSLYINNQSQQHPLLPIYQRLMDIRFRCNAQTALCILEKINFKAWFSIEIKHFSQKQWNQLILALFTCIEETTNVYPSDINSTCSEENDDLHKLCIVHLKALLTNHFPDMFDLAFRLLLQNLSNPKYLDIWVLFQDLLIADISTNSGSTSLSIEQLTQLLNHVHRRLTSTVNSSPVTSLSPLRDTQNVLIDECCSMLQNNSSQTIQMIIHFLMILACQLCEKIGCCILHNHLSIQNGQSIIIDMLIQVFGCILQKCITLYYNGKVNNPTESSTTSSSSTTIQTSYQLSSPSSSFIVYAKCCLKGFSECLNSAIKVCPTDDNPIWSNQLINLFVIWFTSTTCILNNFGDNLKMVPVTSTSSTTTNLCKQDIRKISLPLLIYLSINQKEQDDDSGDFIQNNDEKELMLSKWCLSLNSYIWKPNLDCLDSMIMLLLNCDNFVNRQSIKELASNFLVYLLSNVQWWFDQNSSSSNQSINVPAQRPWLISQSNTLHLENSMIKMDEAYVNSLTFLIVLISSNLQTNDINKDIKTQLKIIMENIQSSLDLSIVSESCYVFILSYLTEQHIPAYYVLMPPTTMEGRLFGLLAAAGGMISKSSDLFTFTQNSSITIKSSTTGLYPNIHNLSSNDYKSSNVYISLRSKRSAYLRKITSLLGYSILCDNPLPSNELDDLLMLDNFLSSFIKTQMLSSSSPLPLSSTSRTDSSIFSVVWNRMSSMMLNLTNNLNLSTSSSVTTILSSPTSTDNDSLTKSQLHSSQTVKILTWLRICNLLSELESVSGQIGWQKSTSQEFKQIVELCNEIILLINRSCSRVEFLSKLDNSKLHHPHHHYPLNHNNKQDHNLIYKIPDYFIHAIIYWLLNNLTINTQINNNNNMILSMNSNINIITTIMPYSINACLSKPLIYSLLSMNSLLDQETSSRFVQLLNATIWSVIDNAPNEISPKDRFFGIYEIYSHIYFLQNKLDFLHSDLFISMCMQNSLHLPLLFIILCRLNYLYRSMNNSTLSIIHEEHNMIIADSMHWLHSIGIYYMNGIDDRSFQLNGWILFLNFIIQLISTSKINFFNNESCCFNHPAWCSQRSNHHDIPNNDYICSSDFLCKRLSGILNELRNAIMVRLKKKKINLTEEKIVQLKKLCTFIECLCCILEAWMISTHSVGLLNLERLSCLTPSNESSDGARTEDITNMEEGSSKELKQYTFVTQDKSVDNTNPTASIISSLLIRLKSITLIEAYQYLCLQFWTDLKPYVKQILQNSSFTSQLSSLRI
ncbi:unnamed protein product [Schistosoma haematobium]|nr:unnamed protein product [Schistosoma haematobium]